VSMETHLLRYVSFQKFTPTNYPKIYSTILA
jgi:hypothetical protein